MQRGDPVGLTRRLVSVDSRNPLLVRGGPGEQEVAETLAQVLAEWGMQVELMETAPGRPNVIARAGSFNGPTLMFNGHLDVVGTDGMVHAPFDAFEVSGRIYGRGASDMKGGVAAMCAAAVRAMDAGLDGGIIVCAVTDEEFESAGTATLLQRGVRADAAIVTEPTQLAIAPAHKGFAWFTVELKGRAAHGSRHDLGIDAIRHAGRMLAALDEYERELTTRSHPLLGTPSIHASLIHGGSGMSTYPENCVVRLERRTIPGETADDALRELEAICDRLTGTVAGFNASVSLDSRQSPSDVPVDAPIVRALESCISERGAASRVEGMSAWTDAALLNDAGIPAICYGPGNMGLAHAAEEYIEVEQIAQATDDLARLALAWCNQ